MKFCFDHITHCSVCWTLLCTRCALSHNHSNESSSSSSESSSISYTLSLAASEAGKAALDLTSSLRTSTDAAALAGYEVLTNILGGKNHIYSAVNNINSGMDELLQAIEGDYAGSSIFDGTTALADWRTAQ